MNKKRFVMKMERKNRKLYIVRNNKEVFNYGPRFIFRNRRG